MTSIKPIILTALPVAFSDDGSLSQEGNEAILKKCAASAVDGAFIIGTTGEFPSLNYDERRKLTRLSLDLLKEKRVVVHVGAPSLYQVAQLIGQAKEEGAKEIAVITPYFLPATDEALLEFYKGVSDLSEGLGVFVYLFKDRTGVTVTPQLMAKIAEFSNIIGVKISGETLETVAKYREVLPESFLVFTGSDREIGRLHTIGAQGVISGIASVYPEVFVALAEAVAAGDTAAQQQVQKDVNAVVDGLLGDIERLKAGLRRQGIKAGKARMSIGLPDTETNALLDELHAKYGEARA